MRFTHKPTTQKSALLWFVLLGAIPSLLNALEPRKGELRMFLFLVSSLYLICERLCNLAEKLNEEFEVAEYGLKIVNLRAQKTFTG